MAFALLGLTVPAAGADGRVDAMVEALRDDPIFVSTAVPRAVRAEELVALRRSVRAAPFPVFVVIAPAYSDEPGLATLDALPDLLHDGLDRDGLYIVANGSYEPGTFAQAFGVPSRTDLRGLGSNVFADRRGRGAVGRARYALSLVTTGRRAPLSILSEQSDGADEPRTGAAVGVGLGIGVLAFVGSGWPYLTGRRRRRQAARAKLAPRPRVTPIDAELERERAGAGVLRLSKALAANDAPPAAAFDAYAAASKLVAESGAPITFVAASTLVDTGEWLLAGSDARSCFFDPRHGEGSASTRWRLGGEAVTLPVCRECAAHVAAERAPAALDDHGRPYFERDTLWARTGLGALEDGLAQRVLAGEGRR